MSHTCPWCREPLARSERSAETCPHCCRPLAGDAGELRRIDLRYEEVEAEQWVVFKQLMIWGSAVAAVLVALLQLTMPFAVPLVLVAHLVVIRVWLTRDSRSLLGPARRFFVRWISRLVFLWVGGLGYSLSATPLVGIVLGAGTFASLTAGAHYYTLWSLRREHERKPLALWEKLTLLALVALTLTLLVLAIGLAVLLGWSIAQLVELISGR